MNNRVYDEPLKKMAVDLSNRRGSVKEVADELGLSHSLLSKWAALISAKTKRYRFERRTKID